MDDKQLKRIEQELIRQMDKELQREEMVEELAKEVAAKLIASGKAEVELKIRRTASSTKSLNTITSAL